MPKLKDGKKMVRGDSDFQFSKNVICCKWFDNKPVLLLATNIEGLDGTSNVMRRTKGFATKTPVSCPNIIMLMLWIKKRLHFDKIVKANSGFI